MFDLCLLVLLRYTSADSNSSQLLSLNALFSEKTVEGCIMRVFNFFHSSQLIN